MRTTALGLGLLLGGCYVTHASPSPFADLDASRPPPLCPGVSLEFSRSEIYVEEASPACPVLRPACMVYEVQGNPRSDCTAGCATPEEASRRAFCTCRCDGPTPCTCAEGEVCDPSAFSVGSFCVAGDLAAP
jgi:hypothetical protein